METGSMLFVGFYSNINIAGQWGYLLHFRGVISFPRFLMGFSVKSNGFGDHLMGFQ